MRQSVCSISSGFKLTLDPKGILKDEINRMKGEKGKPNSHLKQRKKKMISQA